MQKKTNIGIIVAIVIAVCISAPFCAYHIYKSVITDRAVNYLCEKYSEEKGAFEVLDCTVSHHSLNDDAIPQLEKSDSMWEVKYNNRRFFVKQTDGRYVDDYQLEDIEEWAVDYLQKNVDKNIVGIDLSSFHIYSYLISEYPSDPLHLISSADTQQLLTAESFNTEYGTGETTYHAVYVKNYESYSNDTAISVGSYSFPIENAQDSDFGLHYYEWHRSY